MIRPDNPLDEADGDPAEDWDTPAAGDRSPIPLPGDPISRCGVACLSIALGVLSFWILWIVHTFLQWQGWGARLVGLFLHELVLSVVAFATLLLIWAACMPNWVPRVLEAAYRKLSRIVLAFFVLLFGTFFVCLVIVTIDDLAGR
ncbi:MAG: hypothetical protein WBC44_10315 [Planctomycetaceae bacterium]